MNEKDKLLKTIRYLLYLFVGIPFVLMFILLFCYLINNII